MGRNAVAGAVFFVMLLPLPASGQTERIVRFHSDILVHADGWLTVTEMIQVQATGQNIKRGIYRDFPIRYSGRDRARIIVPFEVLRVERDGRPEHWHIKSNEPYQRVYLGQKDTFLKPGVYTYTLTYRTTRQIGFFEDHDELYWNVTGNEWNFPIEQASATVILPASIPRQQIGLEAYTGGKGARGQNYTAAVTPSREAAFQTTHPLAKGEGLTIVVAWPKGFVVPPTKRQMFEWILQDSAVVLAAGMGLIIVVVYFLLAWLGVGRDPGKGTIVPLFEPPDDLSPAALRYIHRMGFDKHCFAASVLNLAVKGWLTIKQTAGDFHLHKTHQAGQADLPWEEQTVMHQLLSQRTGIELDNAHHKIFQKAIRQLKNLLAKTYKGRYFFANFKFFAVGAALSLLTLLAVVLIAAFVEGRPEVGFIAIWLTGWTVGVSFLIRQVIHAWKAARSDTGSVTGKVSGIGRALFLSFFGVPFVGVELFVLGMLSKMTPIYLLPVLVLIGLLNFLFFHLLKRPTPEGRNLMDRIDGFKMYLGTAEEELLHYAHQPGKTPELFEKYLPHALALGVENAWAEKFSEILSQAAMSGEGYNPGWYHGAAWGAVAAGHFASSFADSFSTALSSASTAPGSSSGFGGGGSSGGGGGGGGGGGW